MRIKNFFRQSHRPVKPVKKMILLLNKKHLFDESEPPWKIVTFITNI